MSEIAILGIGSRVKHAEHGEGVVIQATSYDYTITFMTKGILEVPVRDSALEVIDAAEMESDRVSLFEIERSLVDILRRFSDIQETVAMHDKWHHGKIIIQPADSTAKGKEIPIDVFFNKIVMVRDRLRVMEQRINAHDKLTEEDKVNLQQYITRIYGSLTTFNILFKNKDDNFVGDKSA